MRTKSLLVGLSLVLALVLPLALVSAQGSIGVNEVVEGSLSDSQASYALTLESGQTVAITLTSDDFDAYLELMDASGAMIAEDDDSAGNLNSALVFTAPVAGTFTVVVGAYGGTATGAYTLTTAESQVVEIAFGSSTKLMLDGTGGLQYFTFMGKQGDVINLYTDNGDLDLRMTLYGPDGSEVAYDDDSGVGYAPFLRRVMLPASGAYRVEVAPFSEDEAGVANLVLEMTELPMLDSGAQTLMMNDDLTNERFGLTVTEGMAYRVTVVGDVPASGSIEIMLDPEFYDVVSVNFNNTTEISAAFVSTVSGVVSVEMTDYTWSSDGVNYTVEVTPVQ